MNFNIKKKIDTFNKLEAILTKILFYAIGSFLLLIGITISSAIFPELHKIQFFLGIIFSWIIVASYATCAITLAGIILIKIFSLVYAITAKTIVVGDGITISFAKIALAIFALLLILFPAYSMIFPYHPTRSKARDAKRMSDMKQFVSAQTLYHANNNRYLTSTEMPTSIGTYLQPVPNDPTNNNIQYKTVSNIGYDQQYCYYATLENDIIFESVDYKYYIASHAGNFYRTTIPMSLDECAQGKLSTF